MSNVYPPSSTDDTSGKAEGVAAEAKTQGAHLAQGAADATSQVAGTAKDEASKVVGEAKTQAKDLFKQTSSELKEQAETQQKRVAVGLHNVSEELDAMASKSEIGGVATDLVSQAATRAESIATWLDDRDPGTLVQEVRDFARRRPGTFIAGAAIAGVLVGRLTRSLASGNDSAKDAEPAASTTPPVTPTPSATAPSPEVVIAPATVPAPATGATFPTVVNPLPSTPAVDEPFVDGFGRPTSEEPHQ